MRSPTYNNVCYYYCNYYYYKFVVWLRRTIISRRRRHDGPMTTSLNIANSRAHKSRGPLSSAELIIRRRRRVTLVVTSDFEIIIISTSRPFARVRLRPFVDRFIANTQYYYYYSDTTTAVPYDGFYYAFIRLYCK